MDSTGLLPTYRYQATIDRVIDGDTIVCTVDLGFRISHQMHLRLIGVNAPELSEPLGGETRRLVEEWVRAHGPWTVETIKHRTTFARYLGSVYCQHCGSTLNEYVDTQLHKERPT